MKKPVRILVRALGFLMVLYMGNQFVRGQWGLKSYLDARRERGRLARQFDLALAEKTRVADELQGFRKDPLVIEEQVKISLKKGKKGEVYYHFSDSDSQPRHDATPAK